MKRVLICTPYAGTPEQIVQHLKYLEHCMLDSLLKSEAPFASHLLYPKVLDDKKPEARALGIAAEHSWLRCADLVVFYTDLGISPGMQQAATMAVLCGIAIEQERKLPDFNTLFRNSGRANNLQ